MNFVQTIKFFFHACILTLEIIYKILRGNFQAFEGALLYGSEQSITQLEKWLNEYWKFYVNLRILGLKNLEKNMNVRNKKIVSELWRTLINLFDYNCIYYSYGTFSSVHTGRPSPSACQIFHFV